MSSTCVVSTTMCLMMSTKVACDFTERLFWLFDILAMMTSACGLEILLIRDTRRENSMNGVGKRMVSGKLVFELSGTMTSHGTLYRFVKLVARPCSRCEWIVEDERKTDG